MLLPREPKIAGVLGDPLGRPASDALGSLETCVWGINNWGGEGVSNDIATPTAQVVTASAKIKRLTKIKIIKNNMIATGIDEARWPTRPAWYDRGAFGCR